MKKEILNKLIKHYEEAIDNIRNLEADTYNLKLYLKSKHLHLGICHCAKYQFEEPNLFYQRWVTEHCNDLGYWYITPYYCSTITNVIYSLNFRLDKMKQILNEGL